MLREAITKIQELCSPIILHDGDDKYVIRQDGSYSQVHRDIDSAEKITLFSLDALVKIVKTEALSLYNPPVYITSISHDEVACFLRTDPENKSIRNHLYSVEAKDVPGWKETEELTFETALIAIRTRFQQTNDTTYLLKLLSDISNGAKVTYSDNGIATTVVSTKGVALQGKEPINPIIRLKPYRTFQEIDQPSSDFHIRIGERGIKFIEADGGMWKLTARKTIASYLEERFSDDVESGKVVVML